MVNASDFNQIIERYNKRLREEFNEHSRGSERRTGHTDDSGAELVVPKRVTYREYQEFKETYLPSHVSLYERLCKWSARILKLKVDDKTASSLQESIAICHINITPAGAVSFSILVPILIAMLGGLASFLLFQSLFFIVYFIILGLILSPLFARLPEFLANSWRLKASNQMVQCIFYIASYMRHTSNLEIAIDFASNHLAPPLSLDMKRILWDVETGHYMSVKESVDNYLETWRRWNIEFIESFHLIEASLNEPSEDRRLALIDKALSVMLDETYERMLHYAHELKGPVAMLYTLGTILPILGLVILPLVASFMTSDSLTPRMLSIYIATLYNITLPIGIFYLGRVILSKRPTGYGENDISEDNPEIRKYRNIVIRVGKRAIYINPFWIAAGIGGFLCLLGLIPFLLGMIIPQDLLLAEQPFMGPFKFLGYELSDNGKNLVGPYGIGASVLSLFLPLGLGLGFGIYFKLRSKNVIRIRENAKRLEVEFASALFQLGNRLGDGLPVEIAVSKVADIMRDTVSGEFFEMLSTNVKKLGMNVEQAIYSPKVGAINHYPSSVIDSSMRVLIESAKKGPLIASQALINVSEYIKDIHRVNERIRDLMADIISDMKQQITFLAPAIAGIVVGITSMIVNILINLKQQISTALTDSQAASASMAPAGLLQMFGDSIPTYYFQMIVGIYVAQIIFILTILANNIENGADRLGEHYYLGNNLVRSMVIYFVLSLFVILASNFFAAIIMSSISAV